MSYHMVSVNVIYLNQVKKLKSTIVIYISTSLSSHFTMEAIVIIPPDNFIIQRFITDNADPCITIRSVGFLKKNKMGNILYNYLRLNPNLPDDTPLLVVLVDDKWTLPTTRAVERSIKDEISELTKVDFSEINLGNQLHLKYSKNKYHVIYIPQPISFRYEKGCNQYKSPKIRRTNFLTPK